ncbi:unnamed protein product [Parascedosporium putredinis]|uniref:Transcription factor RfeD n=1 Tax=Parascedosporium putredinis TaxID=1442378 RepID=A0A9P1MDG8_9PEZI|nr:unnamed protein product [Parascedosporium putredinis]CAI7998600.1 unnamed protein product [Parascedosporium putredinis]
MQEHIRRAHPEHYISKLPATEESFLLMINTPPSERTPAQQQNSTPATANAAQPPVNQQGASMPPAASAAAALAQLHGHRGEHEWDSEGVKIPPVDFKIGREMLKHPWQQQDWHPDADGRKIPRSSIELPPIHMSSSDVTSDPFSNPNRPRDLLPSILPGSPPGRSSTLPPLHRGLGPTRPRKQSVTKRGREAHHKKQKSKGSTNDWLRRIQNDDRLRPGINDRKALSAEPTADFGKRWEDLIDAADQAASAAGDVDEDRTPSKGTTEMPSMCNDWRSI